MTDDEAFLRAIVAAPADEAPRLVYADWLDERGDPRGAYLRATVTWGQRLKDVGTRDKAERQFRHAARSLDQVWVARVTPPPAGVCCDRVRIQDQGSPVSPARIDQFEIRLGIKLPPAYRGFLLNYNGGTPDPDVFQVGYDSFRLVQVFFSLGERMTDPAGNTTEESLETFAEQLNSPTGQVTMIPVAAEVSSSRAHMDLEDEIRRTDRWPYEWEACLCIKLDSGQLVRTFSNSSPNAPGRLAIIGSDEVAESLPAFLARLDHLPDGWEPYSW